MQEVVFGGFETEVTAKWKKYRIDIQDYRHMEQLFNQDKPVVAAFDSETTGLHIVHDKPVVWAVGWLVPEVNGFRGRVFTFKHDPILLKLIFQLLNRSRLVVGHNVKYDLHMALNGGLEMHHLPKNVADTMANCRLSFEAVSERDGGYSLALKSVTEKFIDPKARQFEKSVHEVMAQINTYRITVLKSLLKPYGWSPSKIKDVYKVKSNNGVQVYTLERKKRWIDVPPEVEEAYTQWLETYPTPTYADVDADTLMNYVHTDVIYTLELFDMSMPVIIHRKQQEIWKEEKDLIYPLLRMEREGYKTDIEYVKESAEKLEEEIKRNYQELWETVGGTFTVSQEGVIKDYYEKVNGVRPSSTDKLFLSRQGDRVAKLISRIRRLEKWQATYAYRILDNAQYDGNFYTQFNPYAAVSGRSSSDTQQFPNGRILTEEGEVYEEKHGEGSAPDSMELFYPRRAFQPKQGTKAVYMDYSQIELRVQGNYTILLNRPDLNMCRAYIPFQCHHAITGEPFRYDVPEERARWSEQVDGHSAWLDEEGKPWTPTDVHSATAHNALVEGLQYTCHERYKEYEHPTRSHIDADVFKHYWRKKGKTFNFMRNYGGGASKASDMLDIDMEVAEALVTGWSHSFPEVAYYQDMVIKAVRARGYATNMYGRAYYIDNPRFAYKVANYNVQGSAADVLKRAIIKIDRFIQENHLKSRLFGQVHDELQLYLVAGEEWIIPHLKKMMEDVPWMQIPLIADVEISTTNWAEAEEVDLA